MTIYQRNGILAGAIAGFVVAFMNWDGRIIVAASSILFATAIGYFIGSYVSRHK